MILINKRKRSKSVSVATCLGCDALVFNYSTGESVNGVAYTNGIYL
ncbi:hypothetical protein BTURTLESOX_54 [bacterium endosymbiont of Bathymodiolus sp. 5 South]|nr:hypothetical protein BTURTLESOX_54 [bacterium endosymbiont of Bathymodiolus sp. 5 South]